MLTGYLIDFLTIGSLFYIASFLYMISGILILRSATIPSIDHRKKPVQL